MYVIIRFLHLVSFALWISLTRKLQTYITPDTVARKNTT